MQYRDLYNELGKMSEEQLSATVLIYDITLHKLKVHHNIVPIK